MSVASALTSASCISIACCISLKSRNPHCQRFTVASARRRLRYCCSLGKALLARLPGGAAEGLSPRIVPLVQPQRGHRRPDEAALRKELADVLCVLQGLCHRLARSIPSSPACSCIASRLFFSTACPVGAIGVTGRVLEPLVEQVGRVQHTAEIISHVLKPRRLTGRSLSQDFLSSTGGTPSSNRQEIMTELNLATAQKIVAAALAEARAKKMMPLSVVVFDVRGAVRRCGRDRGRHQPQALRDRLWQGFRRDDHGARRART